MNLNISPETISMIQKIAITLVVGFLVIQGLVVLVKRVLFKKASQQTQMLITKAVVYTGVVIIILTIINILKLKDVFHTMLGAAGVLGIVLGIASQTSVGNIISGLFLISEKPFEIGDLIRVGGTTGLVYSIDLLSIKLRTFDNMVIRIPNQTIITTEVTNITKFPIRRMNITVSVAYKEDLAKVTEVLKSIALSNPLCLDEPEPLVLVDKFNSSSIDYIFGVWFEGKNFIAVKNSIMEEITVRFRKEGIEIPFPHISVYTGEETKPFPMVKK